MIKVNHDSGKCRFDAVRDEQPAGYCMYELDGDTVTFTHTVVQPEFEGEGVGSALARFVLEDSRNQGLKVVPACRFIAAYIERHDEFKPLVASGNA